MIVAVVKAVFTLLLAVCTLTGAVTCGLAVMLFTGHVSVETVADAMTQGLAYANVACSGLGVAAAGTALRAGTPHAVAGIRDWFVSIVRDQVEQQLK